MYLLTVAQLNQIVDLAIAEIAARPASPVDGVTLRGLDTLKRAHCEYKNGVYVCHVVTDKAVVSSVEDGEMKVAISIPISVHVNGDIFEKFSIGEVDIVDADIVDLLESDPSEDEQYSLWKKIKKIAKKVVNGVKKIVKTAIQIAIETVKAAAQTKANGLANKAIAIILSKIPIIG